VFIQGTYGGLRNKRRSIMGGVLKRFLAEVTGGSFVSLRYTVTHRLYSILRGSDTLFIFTDYTINLITLSCNNTPLVGKRLSL
jgi:hypothetical protein